VNWQSDPFAVRFSAGVLRTAQMLEAGYLEDWVWHATRKRCSARGRSKVRFCLTSTLTDRKRFVEERLLPAYNRGARRRGNPAYQSVKKVIVQARRLNDREKGLSTRAPAPEAAESGYSGSGLPTAPLRALRR
jgi:hypothetical protein